MSSLLKSCVPFVVSLSNHERNTGDIFQGNRYHD